MQIIGAGLAGLLAGNMLRGSEIFEKKPSLPNNHHAVLRFRTPQVGDVLGIPFRKVRMIATVIPWRNPVADAMAYSFKNTGVRRTDRSITRGLVEEDRWVAPPDLISRMATGLTIHYDSTAHLTSVGPPIISTIPMPNLMELLQYPHRPTFNFRHGSSIKLNLANSASYASILVPVPDVMYSRISVTGDEVIAEFPCLIESATPFLDQIAYHLGCSTEDFSNVRTFAQPFAKILPLDEKERKDFIAWATDKHNVYSLGRFATWRPGLLLDDLVKDIRLIQAWVGNRYSVLAHRR